MTGPVMIDGARLLHLIERLINEELDCAPQDRASGIEAYQACSGAVSSAIRGAGGVAKARAVFAELPHRGVA